MINFRFQLPSLSVLTAFECAARHGNFSRAAVELNSSQPAISRHIASMEGSLGVKVFIRNRGRVALTPDGNRLYHAASSGLEEIAAAVRDIQSSPKRVSIGCSHAVSHLWLMPRYGQVQAHIGNDVEIVTVTSEYEYQGRWQEDGIDINLTFSDEGSKDGERFLLFPEQVFPVCSPTFVEKNAELISRRGIEATAELPLLHLGQRNYGWATWDKWFEGVGLNPRGDDGLPKFANYVYLLEAACNNAGIALGWSGLVDSYLAQNRLITLSHPSLTTTGGLYLSINRTGRNRVLAEQTATCLTAL